MTTHGAGQHVRRWWPVCTFAAWLLFVAVPITYAEDARLGTTVDGLLVEAARLSPEIAARALDAAAAEAGARAAGSLPDPTLRATQDEIDVLSGPRRPKQIYAIEQEFPLWGKRELKAATIRAQADIARAEGRMVEAELAEQVKIVFAQYWVAHRASAVLQEVHGI